jgi:hypothetical protein
VFHETYQNRIVRRALADASVPISIGIFTGLAYAPKIADLPFLNVPTAFQPTSGRAWVLQYDQTMPIWAYFAAILPALILTALVSATYYFTNHTLAIF